MREWSKRMIDLNDAPIAEKLESYRLARGIRRGSPQWSQLLLGYQRNPQIFAELLDQELTRIRQLKEGSPQ
jgi:hypothetical protein